MSGVNLISDFSSEITLGTIPELKKLQIRFFNMFENNDQDGILALQPEFEQISQDSPDYDFSLYFIFLIIYNSNPKIRPLAEYLEKICKERAHSTLWKRGGVLHTVCSEHLERRRSSAKTGMILDSFVPREGTTDEWDAKLIPEITDMIADIM